VSDLALFLNKLLSFFKILLLKAKKIIPNISLEITDTKVNDLEL
jgi:hypothetical protein